MGAGVKESDGDEAQVLDIGARAPISGRSWFQMLHSTVLRCTAASMTPEARGSWSPAGSVLDLLRKHSCVLLRDYFDEAEVSRFPNALHGLLWQQMRRAAFLGCFDFVDFPVERTPRALRPYVRKLAATVPEIEFTRVWVQRYEVGQFICEHKDPGTYRGCVAVAVFGDFVGAVSTIEGTQKEGAPGDVFLLRGNLDGLPMPSHQVSPVLMGTRYVILLTSVAATQESTY